MKTPPRPHDEMQRLDALRTLRALDTPVEERFERITRLAQKFFGVAMAAITLVDEERQWFKSIQGLDTRQTDRRISFCGHALLEEHLFVVEDAAQDPRFADNPLVTGHPHIRFYAGIPLRARNRQPVGTLCLIDNRPRQAADMDFDALQDLASLTEREFTFDSPGNRAPTNTIRGGARENLLDEVTGLWNWAGLVRQLEESNQRLKLIGGDMTLVWLRVGFDRSRLSAEETNHLRRDWAEKLLSGLEFFDTAGVVSEGDFLMMVSESDRAQLLVRLGMVAQRLSPEGGRDGDQRFPTHLAFAAIRCIDGRLGVAELLDQLEMALPDPDNASGTLALIDGNQRSRVALL